jgi:hypothetical protein
MIRELWRYRKLTTKTYPIGGAAVAAGPTPVPIELTQYSQEDVFDRLLIEVSGNVIVAGGGAAGVATGAPNPHGLLNKLQLQTQPQYNGIVPVNNLSARSLLNDAFLALGSDISLTELPIPDIAGTYAVDFFIPLMFKRPGVRKGIEWAFFIQKYTSALLTLNFGGREQLFVGGTNTWDLSALNIVIWADSDLAVQVPEIHGSEMFEQTYPINAAQHDFPIDTLPPGYIYTDIVLQTEVAGVLANTVLNNIDLEGGGRVWLPQGDNNAFLIQHMIGQARMNDSPTANLTGIYPIPLRDGMYTRGIDALKAPVTLKLDVNAPGANRLVRLLCRRMIPGAVQRRVNPKPAVQRQNVAGH